MSERADTTEELVIARIAREFEGEVVAMGATVCSLIATRLAKRLHNPDLLLVGGNFNAWDCDPGPKLLNDDFLGVSTARAYMDWEQNFRFVAAGKVIVWVGPVQIDALGNSNISAVGDWSAPKVQLVCARGIPDNVWGMPKLYYHLPRHSPRSFVERVDFVCGRGNDEVRERLGIRTGRPGVAVTDLGVFDWPDDGRMHVQSLHPGVTLEEVVAKTGFELGVPDDVPVTAEPTDEELRIIREEVDPLGLRRLESSSPPALAELVEAERAYFETVPASGGAVA